MDKGDVPFIERELREAFPRRKFVVSISRTRINIQYSTRPIDLAKVKRVVSQWHRAAHGYSIRWGKTFQSPDWER